MYLPLWPETRASRHNLHSVLCVRHVAVFGRWSAVFWELYGFLLGVLLLCKYVRSSGREWSELSYMHFLNNLDAENFLRYGQNVVDSAAPHLSEMVRICKGRLSYVHSRLGSCVIGLTCRYKPPMYRAHKIAHGPPTDVLSKKQALEVSCALRCMLKCYYSKPEEERDEMREY